MKTKPKVLVVDDSEMMRRSMVRVLKKEFEVTTARNGKDGLDLILTESFDAIITDVDMPVMSGNEMYLAILERAPDKSRRVVFMTGDSRRGPRYLIKPVDPVVLCKILHKVAEMENSPSTAS